MRFATRGGAPVTMPYMAYQSPFGSKAHAPSLITKLDAEQRADALRLFRSGKDTVEIASIMEATQFAVANGIARARDEERRSQ